MTSAVATRTTAATLEEVLIEGNLARLSAEQRIEYYRAVCESAGLNPLTRPFDYLTLNGKLVLYCNRGGTDQLRLVHGISVTHLETALIGDVFVVTANGATASGRTDSATGAVPVAGLKGEALANAYMKAETKAKRRLTLSLSGLGFLDESEVQSIPTASRTDVDRTTGEILPPPRQVAAASPVEAVGPSDAEIAALRERFSKSEVSNFDLSDLDGLSSADLFSRAEEAGIPSAKLTLTAKTMFGANRWKITDLTDQERLAIWDEVQ